MKKYFILSGNQKSAAQEVLPRIHSWRDAVIRHNLITFVIIMFPSQKKATLLVVDSNPLSCSSTARFIKTMGYDALMADNGDTCLEYLNSRKIEVLFLDIDISGKNSFEILAYIHDHLPDLPVIMTSSSMSEENESESFSKGAFEYLIKPVNSARLEITIKKALTESERRQEASLFSVVITNSPIAIAITDKDGNFEYVNNAFSRTTGYSLNEAIGKNPRILKSGEQSDTYYKELWETINSGKNWQGEFVNKKKNGELYWENSVIIPIIDPTWAISHFVSIKQDISLRKQEQEAFSESERRFQELADLLPHPVFEMDLQGLMTYSNREGFETFGYTAEDLEGGVQSLTLFGPEERDRIQLNIEHCLKEIHSDNYEYSALRKGGETFPSILYLAKIVQGGNPVGIRCVVLDISARKQLEEKIAQLNQALEECMKSK